MTDLNAQRTLSAAPVSAAALLDSPLSQRRKSTSKRKSLRVVSRAILAMLDASRTGVVISAIQGRDYARIYVKELDQGRAPVALSPEEREAVERAMAR